MQNVKLLSQGGISYQVIVGHWPVFLASVWRIFDPVGEWQAMIWLQNSFVCTATKCQNFGSVRQILVTIGH